MPAPVHRVNTFLFPLLLVSALTLLAFAFQGARGIYAPDEGFYVGIGQSMQETGDYVIPRLQSEPWLDKPPLSMWGIAAGIELLGRNETGARAFHAACFVLTVLLVVLLGRSLYGPREGWLAGVMYATMVLPFAAGNIVTPDTPLVLWTTAAMFCFWKAVEPGARREPLWKLLMCAAFGLGFLTKGPAAIVPSGALFVYLLLQRRAGRFFLSPWFAAGVCLFCLLGLGWYAAVSRELPGALAYFLDNQLIGRTISGKYDRYPGLLGAAIYLPVVLLGTLPWSAVWWPALWRRRAQGFARPRWTDGRQDPRGLFLFLWIAVTLLVLAAASSKLPLYALPVFPALALVTARIWPSPRPGTIWRSNPLGVTRGTVLLIAGLFVALPAAKLAMAHIPMKEDMRGLAASLQGHLPQAPYELVSVTDHLEALGFYGGHRVARVTIFDTPYPFYVLPRHLKEMISSMDTSDHAHVFVCREDWQSQIVTGFLNEAGRSHEEVEIPFFGTRLIRCLPSRS